jgi:hypothetical protein
MLSDVGSIPCQLSWHKFVKRAVGCEGGRRGTARPSPARVSVAPVIGLGIGRLTRLLTNEAVWPNEARAAARAKFAQAHQQTVKFTVAAWLVTGASVEARHSHSRRSSPKLRHLSAGLDSNAITSIVLSSNLNY